MSFDINRWKTVPGMLEDIEGQILYQEAFFTKRNARVLEIGSYMGKSAIAMLQGLRDINLGGALMCVDPFAGDGMTASESSQMDRERGRGALTANIRAWNLEPWFAGCYPLTSAEFFAMHPASAKFDLIFIDGLHTIVDQDILGAYPLLKPGGVLLCHDYHKVDPDYFWITALIDKTGVRGTWLGPGTTLWIAFKTT